MAGIIMHAYIVNELDFTNELTEPGALKLNTRATYNVDWAPNQNRCRATYVVDMMKEDDPNSFNFKLSIRGMFEYEEGMDKEEVREQTFNELFPFARTIVANTFTNAGLPPMMIQKASVNPIKKSENAAADGEKYYS